MSELGTPPSGDTIERKQAFAKVNAALFGTAPQPQRMGRYMLLERQGAGAMGVVYSAYDPQLDRKIALKLLRRGQGTDDELRGVLLQEARAMARLTHPNVVTVHEVGESSDRIFLAMEFVAGGTLRAWMNEGPRPWSEVVRVFVRAGAGLAAAHEANLAHRDFKPENVLMTASGEPRVADFGLAQVADVVTPEAQATDEVDVVMTSGVDGRVGTPAYMAPEVFGGDDADPLSDQYSFAVALFEALYGPRPFQGESVRALQANVEAGRLSEPTDLRGVPTSVRRVVDRALSVERSQRHPSMRALLDALREVVEPGARAGWWTAGGVALASVGVAAWSYAAEPADGLVASVCDGGGARVAEVWTAERGRLVAASAGASPEQVEAFVQRGDDYADAWADAYREACWDTAVLRVQSEERMDARMLCLDGRLRGFGGSMRVIENDAADDAESALKILENLPSVEECADPRRDGFESPPKTREGVLQVEEQLAQARALDLLSDPEQAISILETQLERSRELGEPRLLTRALVSIAALEVRSGQAGRARKHIDEARLEAERAGLDLLLVRILIMRAADAGLRRDNGQAKADLEVAAAILHRYGGDSRYEAQLLVRRGIIAYHSGDPESAVELYQRGLERFEEIETEIEATIGALVNLGLALRDLGRNDEAMVALEDARRRSRESFGPQNPELPSIDLHIAMVLDEVDRLDDALVVLRRGQRILDATRQGASMDGVQHHAGFAWIHQRLEQHGDALEHSVQAVQDLRSLGQERHPDMAMCASYAGAALVKLGRPEESLPLFREALAVNEALLGRSHPEVADTLMGLGRAERALEHWSEAQQAYARALQIRLAYKLPGPMVGEAREALALSLRHSNRAEARNVAALALEDYASTPELREAAAERLGDLVGSR